MGNSGSNAKSNPKPEIKPPPVVYHAPATTRTFGFTSFPQRTNYEISTRPYSFPPRPPYKNDLKQPATAPPLAIKPPPQRNITELLGSFRTWQESYRKATKFNTRIAENADELYRKNDLEAHRIRLQRIEQSTKFICEKESINPSLTINSCLDISDRLQSLRTCDSKYFPIGPKHPELTPEMLEEIQQASRPQPMNEALVEIDGVQILRKDIQTLLGLNWLNDEIVNAYMNLLVLRGQQSGYKTVYAFNTFFYPKLRDSGYSSVRRWTRKVDVFSYHFIVIPVHLGNHWCLALIDFGERIISYYDSLGGQANGCCDTLLDYLRDESNDKKKQCFDDENWRLVNRSNDGIPKQGNYSDCGVFACTYAEYLTRQAKFDFGQKHMPYFRKKMIYEIIKRKILE